jgi:hypothetical protein
MRPSTLHAHFSSFVILNIFSFPKINKKSHIVVKRALWTYTAPFTNPFTEATLLSYRTNRSVL